eukprot:TRINITY_DN2914_c0_g3_i1.p1 TRINITY_DN2914_c0_g3~~TRINITY_DN2914_c0_g3_i1.p1  ORF type:complete len:2335 (+),score=602.05 TRINITY_DN2914_c0_g3_i1:435-7007(+)
MIWTWQGQPLPAQTRDAVTQAAKQSVRMSEAVAEVVVRTIQRYYAVQVLEPSTRGFLSILEKQFARSDLYLFEVLQNAVDDGALHVCFEPTRTGLAVRHDGRRFTALDVLGLSSVGLSTKGDGQKRTIGFMGIGFKAVYKRYARVVVHDRLWRFSFEETAAPGQAAGKAGATYGWVLQPRWETPQALWDQPGSPTAAWCHFQLERPREGLPGVQRDLAKLPDSVPGLLGRKALRDAARRGSESLVQLANLGIRAGSREFDALQHWWLQAQRLWGVLAPELLQRPLVHMLGLFKQQGINANKDAIWKHCEAAALAEVQKELEVPERLQEWGWRLADDATGQVLGPFPASQCRQWVSEGRLTATVRVSGRGMGGFKKIQEVFPQGSPFVSGAPPACFRLDWGNAGQRIALADQLALKEGIAEEVHVHHGGAQGLVRWLFITIVHRPDQQAREAYEKHARREHVGEEEVSLFFSLDKEGSPVPVPQQPDGSGRGSMHAVLPTELRTQVGGHLQASWLLSVDRQRMQDFADNAWNRALLMTLPRLLQVHLRWVAEAKPKNLAKAYEVLPEMEISPTGNLSSKALGQDMSWDILSMSMKVEPLVPALTKEGKVQYLRAQEVVWLPPSFVELLPPEFLLAWLGLAPLAAGEVGSSVWHPLWFSVRQIDQVLLLTRKKALEAAIRSQEKPAAVAVKLLAALGQWAQPELAGPSGITPAAATAAVAAAAASPAAGQLPVGGVVPPRKTLSAAPPAALSAPITPGMRMAGIKQPGAVGTVPTPVVPQQVTAPVGVRPFASPNDAKMREAWVQRLPAFHMWPVFWTAKGECVAAAGVNWPDESWSKLSPEVREILEGSLGGEGRQALHPELLPLTAVAPGFGAGVAFPAFGAAQGALPSVEGTTPNEVKCARACLQQSRRQVPNTAMGVAEAVAKKMQQWQMEGAVKGLPQPVAEKVVALSRWAMDNNDFQVLTHALTGETTFKLVPMGDLHIRTEELSSLEKLASVKLAYVSPLYTAKSPQEAPRWEAFWRKCGLRSTFSFAAMATDLQPMEHRFLPGGKVPARRTSKKDGDLPYGLGSLHHQALKVVDVSFSSEWASLVNGLSQVPPPSGKEGEQEEEWLQNASALARLVSKLIVDVEGSGVPPADVPQDGLPLLMAKPVPGLGKSLPLGASPPSHRRLYFMPPGQPGESKLALSPANWLRQLTTARWVPGREGGSEAKKCAWFRPCEVLLKPDAARPGLPLAALPSDVVRALQSEALKGMFAWGTVAPEPPVERLAALGLAAAKKAPTGENPEPLWRAIAHAHRLGSLKPPQMVKLRSLGQYPVFPAPEGLLDKAECVTAARCVALAGGDATESEEVQALVEAKWLVDVRSRSWPLHDVADEVLKLVDIPARPNKACVEAFINWCSTEEPENPSDELRNAFTHGLGMLVQEAKKLPLKPPEAMKRVVPGLKLFCKEGPGLGKGRFPSRWLPAYVPGPKGVRPVLNDDASKAAMLTPAQGLQLLGVLDHPESRFPSQARLQAKDAQILASLKVMCLSDPSLQLQTKITGETILVPGAADRIAIVLKLLWRSAGKELPKEGMEVRLKKCEAIARELSLGATSDKASCMETFAIWGKPDENSGVDLLVAGDPDDYAAEVEELFEARFDTIFKACESRPAKVLRLLRHLETDREFNKFLSRDFEGVIEQQELERRKAEAQRLLKEAAEGKLLAQQQAKQQAEEAAAAAAAAAAQAKAAAEAKAKAAALAAPKAAAHAAPKAAPAAPVANQEPQTGDVQPESVAEEAEAEAESVVVVQEVKGTGRIAPLPNMARPGLVGAADADSAPSDPSVKAPAFVPAASEDKAEVAEGNDDAAEEPAAKRQKLSEEQNAAESKEPAPVLESGEPSSTAPASSDPAAATASAADAGSADTMQTELERLRRENEALRTAAGPAAIAFPVLGQSGSKEDEEDGEEDEGPTVVTKGQIKRMKLEAKEVLYRPISEGFGFKMLQKMGWKEGEGIGKTEKGLATPLWVDPREGKAGLFSAEAGEVRPKKAPEDPEDWYNPKPLSSSPIAFVTEGGAPAPAREESGTGGAGLGFVPASSSSSGSRALAPGVLPRPARPSVAAVAPAVLGLLTDQRMRERGGSGVAGVIGQLLAEALSGEAGERFLRLVDERLGPQVAPQLAATLQSRPDTGEDALQPLWQLTRHHVPGQAGDSGAC